MTEYDKKAKVGDCSFILLTKFPSGDVHVVNVPSRELQDWMVRKEIFFDTGNAISGNPERGHPDLADRNGIAVLPEITFKVFFYKIACIREVIRNPGYLGARYL